MKQHPISYHLTPYGRLDAKELARFALATTRRKSLYFTVRLIHFLGFYMPPYVLTLILLSRVLTILCPILIGIFSLTILCITRGYRLIYLCTIRLFSFFLFLGPKDIQGQH
jgi:hypothetical protein